MEKKEKYFSDKQVSLILKRALELQKTDSKSLQETDLSSTDLEKIALEAGINSDYLRKAMWEVEEGSLKGSKNALRKFLGSKHRIIFKKEIPWEIPAEEYENLLPVIHKAAQVAGNHNVIGNTFTWKTDFYQGGQQVIYLMITSKNGKTEVSVECNLGQVAGGLFGGLMGGIGIGAGVGVGVSVGVAVLASFLFTVLFTCGAVGVSYLLARIIFHAVSKSYQKKMKRIMNEIVKKIESKT